MALKASKIAGLKYEPEYHRYYPAAETASHVIGKTNNNSLLNVVNFEDNFGQ